MNSTQQKTTVNFAIDKIVEYLKKYKDELPTLYTWKFNIKTLETYNILDNSEVDKINNAMIRKESNYKIECLHKEIIGKKLNKISISDKNFEPICLWIIKEWGGIKRGTDTLQLVKNNLGQEPLLDFKRIASYSKVRAFMYPEKNVIYDARVAYSLNWIILSQNAGTTYFPIPPSRNTKMEEFDLVRLIKAQEGVFISKDDAYRGLNALIGKVHKKLWEGDKEKLNKLYYTEMILFSIADRDVVNEIKKQYGNKVR